MFDVSKKVALGAALTAPLVTAVFPASHATAAPAPPAPLDHCVTHALSPQELKDGQRSVSTCYATLDESRAAVGAQAAGIQPVGLSDGAMTSATSVLLATHFDSSDGSGASLLVYGECNGGGISLEGSSWNDRISSTRNGACATVKHFDSTSYSGLQENTVGGVLSTLGLLNNGVGSIKYTN